LSGIILGPPNHHSYTDKVKEIHRTRFSDMSLEDYRNRIEVLHDPLLVEQWKEEFRKLNPFRYPRIAIHEAGKVSEDIHNTTPIKNNPNEFDFLFPGILR